jgi:uncharacterized protein YchJ
MDDTEVSRLPSAETLCACASGRSYAICCRRFHTDSTGPAAALDLLRSRYSAYAYRLPAYIMRTTHHSTAERDRAKWRSEIMAFASEYRFIDGYACVKRWCSLPEFGHQTCCSEAHHLHDACFPFIVMLFCWLCAERFRVEVLEQTMTSADTTTILFRANLQRRTHPVSFLEMSKFVREGNQW